RGPGLYGGSKSYSICKVWNVQNWQEVFTFKTSFDHHISKCAFSPDNLFLAVASGDYLGSAEIKENVVTIFDTQTWSVIARLEGHRRIVEDCSFSPDGSLLITAGFDGM